MYTASLFDDEVQELALTAKIEQASDTIYSLFDRGHPLVIAYSGGRDSTVVSSLALAAAARFVRDTGRKPCVIVTTGDTLVENPEIVQHYEECQAAMIAYGRRHGFEVHAYIVTPLLGSTFQVKILSGRGIPSFAGTQSDCSQDLKIQSQRRFRKVLLAELNTGAAAAAVTALGTRFAESDRRAGKMRARGESAMAPVQNRDGDWIISPIATWSNDDVLEYAGLCASSLIESFTDFADTERIYAHSAGTSCSVVADIISEGTSKNTGCGTRHGCWTCLQAEDKSLANMIEFDSKYEYARGLNRLNRFLRNTRYDWSRRHWIGRTIRGGYVAIEPDTYHPTMLRELSRYMLQLDVDEFFRARAAGEERRFRILSAPMMVAIDALQSLNGLARPFAIWADLRDIAARKVRYDIPEVAPPLPRPMPPTRFLFVGDEWGMDVNPAWAGRRDPYLEALCADSPCEPVLAEMKNGKLAWDVDTSAHFDVHEESAYMIVEFEQMRLAQMHDEGISPAGITGAYKWYLQFGALQLSHAQRAHHDLVLRRTAQKASLGLVLDYDIKDVLAQSVSFSDMPKAARAAWRHKATTETAQTGFAF